MNELLTRRRAEELAPSGWRVEGCALVREYGFRGFSDAVEFLREVARIADEMDHHPDAYVSYGKLRLVLFTHSVGGLTEKDIELARRIEELARQRGLA